MSRPFDLEPYFAHIGEDPIRDAFASRRPLMPWVGSVPVADEDVASAWEKVVTEPAQAAKRLVYVHVPFCRNHCLFCGFYRYPVRRGDLGAYTDALVAEVQREADWPAVAERPIHAVYLGGGTPSALEAKDLSRLLQTIRRSLPLAPDCEITVEGRIVHFDSEKIAACQDAGANRFSIGVQSFDTGVRQRQGRYASRDRILHFLDELRRRERAAIVIDLLFGLPGQTSAVWEEDLRTAVSLGLDGIDLYCLNVFPGTPLFDVVRRGACAPAASLSEQGEMYRTGSELLAAEGWRQLSNSHWARTTRERNLYNLLIKEGADCLAYGAGAGGSLGTLHYAVDADRDRYEQAVRIGQKPIGSLRRTRVPGAPRDAIVGGLEKGRLDLRTLEGPEIPDFVERLHPLIEQWYGAGLLESAGPVLRLTTAGRFWHTNLILALMDLLAHRTPELFPEPSLRWLEPQALYPRRRSAP